MRDETKDSLACLSLGEIRQIQQCRRMRDIWTPFEAIFAEKGYTLWTIRAGEDDWSTMVPPAGLTPRIREGVYLLHDTAWPQEHLQGSAVNCYASQADGSWVVIRLIQKGDDGADELAALRRAATGMAAANPLNHTLQMLDEIKTNDLTFGVFPCWAVADWPCNGAETVNLIHQLMEGVAYLHSKLIVHFDTGLGNIVVNSATERGPIQQPGQPFYNLFPARFSLIDFECCVTFALDSKPDDCRVTGFPLKRTDPNITLARLARPMAPEMLSPEPYDPFAAEVYQLAAFLRCADEVAADLPPLGHLLQDMMALKPGDRPTAAEALKRMTSIKEDLPRSIAIKAYEEGNMSLLDGQYRHDWGGAVDPATMAKA